MAFPSSPINEQIVVVNNITYVYNSALGAWFRSALTTANVITTDTANIVSTISSTSTTTGALTVAGGAGIAGNLTVASVYSTNYFYANGAAFTGGAGYTGSIGASGPVGYTGSVGNIGATGATGAGYTGSAGATGASGVGYTGSAGAGTNIGYVTLSMPGTITAPVTGTARYYPVDTINITTVYANLGTVPAGNFTFVIKKNNVSIGTVFSMSGYVMTPVTVNFSLTTTDYLTLDITGANGADLTIKLKYTY